MPDKQNSEGCRSAFREHLAGESIGRVENHEDGEEGDDCGSVEMLDYGVRGFCHCC